MGHSFEIPGLVKEPYLGVGILGCNLVSNGKHIPSAQNYDIPALGSDIHGGSFPYGGIIGHFANFGIELIAILLVDLVKAFLTGIEEGLVAQGTVYDVYQADLVGALFGGFLCASRKGQYHYQYHKDSNEFLHVFLLSICARFGLYNIRFPDINVSYSASILATFAVRSDSLRMLSTLIPRT